MAGYQEQRLVAIARAFRQGAQLHYQAFPQIARANSWRIQMLQVFKGNVQIIDVYPELRRQQPGKLLQILRKIPIVIQAVDQQADNSPVALRDLAKA